ncbi:MAG: hypothetical protein RQ736_12785 [Thiogranum sp.]|nr:hypothetical protein [Thiogranum sp.]
MRRLLGNLIALLLVMNTSVHAWTGLADHACCFKTATDLRENHSRPPITNNLLPVYGRASATTSTLRLLLTAEKDQNTVEGPSASNDGRQLLHAPYRAK